jgi:ubiquinone/menaquinone biosynthesis C-methylase UbiE
MIDLSLETKNLRRHWKNSDPAKLKRYLVSRFQDPRVNAQSAILRHELVRTLFGNKFDELANKELRFIADVQNVLLRHQEETGERYSGKGKANRGPDAEERFKKALALHFGDQPDAWATKWSAALSSQRAEKISVLEAACGSANDYRYFVSYGIAPFIDYSGYDLTKTNIINSREMFPSVNFYVGNILDMKETKDNSVDVFVASDIYEHIHIEGAYIALAETARVTKRRAILTFFRMADIPDHIINPVKTYHVNTISKPLFEAECRKYFKTLKAINLIGLFNNSFSSPYYNPMAETLVLDKN